MNLNRQLLKSITIICSVLIVIGMAVFAYGYFASGYQTAVTGVGIGAAMGGTFIFIMGIFLLATEEMLEKHQ